MIPIAILRMIIRYHAEKAIFFLTTAAADAAAVADICAGASVTAAAATVTAADAVAAAATAGVADAAAGIQHWNRRAAVQFQRTLFQYFGDAIVIGLQFAFEFEQFAVQTPQISVHQIVHQTGQMNFLIGVFQYFIILFAHTIELVLGRATLQFAACTL